MSTDKRDTTTRGDTHLAETVVAFGDPSMNSSKLGPQDPPPSFDPDALIGVTIENYRIEVLLGTGGFGAVYRARDTKLDRAVALKFLKNPMESIHRELFEREAKVLAALSQHPAIVQIFGWGEYKDLVYFILEFLPTGAERFLREYPRGVPTAWSLHIVRETASALHFAHNHQLLHRDVKPENILIDAATRRIKLADFGLVSMVDPENKSILAGRVSGSPPYMSPEQASGAPLDARSDIYSLGVTLYRLLCGKLPTESSRASQILEDIRNDNRVPLSKRRPDLPTPVLNLVATATAHRPEDRFPDAEAFGKAINEVLEGSPEDDGFYEASKSLLDAATKPLPYAKPLPRRRLHIAAVAAAFIVAMLAGGLILTGDRTPPLGGIASAADELLNAGDYAAAEAHYLELLAEHPAVDELLLGMGYALLHQARADEARGMFASIATTAWRDEGLAAVAFATSPAAARDELEALAGPGGSPYAAVLLATADLMDDRHNAVIERLDDIQGGAFRFRWQYAQALTTLGQAHFKSGNAPRARAVFASLAEVDSVAENAPGRSIAEAYLSLLMRQEDAREREDALARARALGERIQAGAIPEWGTTEQWSSRPLRFLVLPSQAGQSRYAHESGLAEVLPELLGRSLDSHPRLEWIDRDELDVVLAEQELTSYLGSDAGKLQLGRLLGARLLIEGQFLSLFNEESLTGKLVDAETTLRLPLHEIPLGRGLSARDAVEELSKAIGGVIAEHYPLQGRLTRDDDLLAIDLGGAVAIEPGTRFLITRAPDVHARPLENAVVLVEAVLGHDYSRVRIEGAALTPDDIPEPGLFVIEEQWHRARYPGSR